MNALEEALRRLPKVNPEDAFLKASKARLMKQIKHVPTESPLIQWIKQWGKVDPSETYIAQARQRLMHRIEQMPMPLKGSLRGLALLFSFLKKAVASTLVMVIAVMATLFYVQGNAVVEASDNSFLEVTHGTASVKHADMLAWETVSQHIELQAGDLIRLKEDTQATVHFFDDTQVRLNQNTTLLISQLVVSPAYAGQGIIEVNLNEGEAWAQALNVDDGYARFSLITPEASITSLNGSFNVERDNAGQTHLSLYEGKADVIQLGTVAEQPQKKTRLMAGQQLSVGANTAALLAQQLDEVQMNDPWVQRNLEKNKVHLADLRAKDLNTLTLLTGTLPGESLYFIKKAKEELKLVLSDDADLSLKINIANQRLNEAIVLLESGETEKGQKALASYQALALEIAEARKQAGRTEADNKKLANQLIVPHQKFLNAQVTNEATVTVKDALHKTAEILAETPLELATVKLRNNVDQLQDTRALLASGDVRAAKEKLTAYTAKETELLQTIAQIQDPELQKQAVEETLALKEEQKAILASVSETLKNSTETDPELVALVESVSSTADEDLRETLVAVLPLYPELAPASPTSTVVTAVTKTPSEQQLWAQAMLDKITIYSTWQGQKNQIDRLINDQLNDPAYLEGLNLIREGLDGRSRTYLTGVILQLQNQAGEPVVTSTNPEPVAETGATEVQVADPIEEVAEPTTSGTTSTDDPSTTTPGTSSTSSTSTSDPDPTGATIDPTVVPQ